MYSIERAGYNVMVSDLLEKNATQADRESRVDIADWLIRELKASTTCEQPQTSKVANSLTGEEKTLTCLGSINSAVYSLIDKLDLVSATTGKQLRTQIN